MLIDLQNAVIKAPPTALDSLKHSMAQLQVKVDSLQKVSERAEIGKEFFSDAISSNLYNFAIILGFLGFISISSIAAILINHKRLVRKDALKIVADHIEKYDNSLTEIRSKLLATIFNAARSMYFNAIKNSTENHMFNWCMSTVSAYMDLEKTDDEYTIMWLDKCAIHLNKVLIGDSVIKTNINNYIRTLKKTENSKNLIIQTKTKNLREDLLNICHSKPSHNPNSLLEKEEEREEQVTTESQTKT